MSEASGKRPIQSFKDLDVWQASLRLAQAVYGLTREFPVEERFGLVPQMRRGAVSVMSNIAEGYGRGARQDYIRFLRIARGAAAELEAQIILARSLGLGTDGDYPNTEAKLGDVQRLLAGLLRSLE